MTTLTEFLLARITEDEAVARRATGAERTGNWWLDPDEGGVTEVSCLDVQGFITAVDVDAAHIARHDPARVLADCDAKRRIVKLHKSWPVLVETPMEFETAASSTDPTRMVFRASQQIAWTTEQEYRNRFGAEPPTGPILRALALPYATHPDYDESWRP